MKDQPQPATLTISLSKARDGRDYVQIMSNDMSSINIVLVTEHIEILDRRAAQDRATALKEGT